MITDQKFKVTHAPHRSEKKKSDVGSSGAVVVKRPISQNRSHGTWHKETHDHKPTLSRQKSKPITWLRHLIAYQVTHPHLQQNVHKVQLEDLSDRNRSTSATRTTNIKNTNQTSNGRKLYFVRNSTLGTKKIVDFKTFFFFIFGLGNFL